MGSAGLPAAPDREAGIKTSYSPTGALIGLSLAIFNAYMIIRWIVLFLWWWLTSRWKDPEDKKINMIMGSPASRFSIFSRPGLDHPITWPELVTLGPVLLVSLLHLNSSRVCWYSFLCVLVHSCCLCTILSPPFFVLNAKEIYTTTTTWQSEF